MRKKVRSAGVAARRRGAGALGGGELTVAVAVDMPFRQAAGVFEGVSGWAFARGTGWRLLPMQPGFETRLVGLAELGGLDAAIGTFMSDAWIGALTARGIEAVNVFHLSRITSVPCVGMDESRIGRDAARHLIGQGAKTLAFLGGGGLLSTRLRGEGFRGGVGGGEVVECRGGVWLEDDLARLAGSPRPIGLFCASDSLALDAIAAARGHSLEPGRDLLVAGVGDDPAASIFAGIPLSTFEVPAREIGSRAAALLEERLAGQAGSPSARRAADGLVPAQLIARDSSLASRPSRLVQRARDLAAARHAEPEFGVAELARACGASRRLLETTLRAHGSPSPARLISDTRLAAAKALLGTTSISIHQVAAQAGFTSQHHFSAWFRKQTGQPPRSWRESAAVPAVVLK